MKTLYRLIPLFLAFSILVSCSHNHEETNHADDPGIPGSEEIEENEVHLSRQQIDNISIEYESVTGRNIRSIVKLNGRVELPADGIAIASTPLEGQIEEVHVLPGDKIVKDRILFTIRNMDLIDWQETWVKADADLVFLNAEIERQQYLSDQKISPVRKLEELIAEKKKVEGQLSAIQNKLKVAGVDLKDGSEFSSLFNVRAPQGGVIQHLNVHKGSFVTPETEMVRIISNHHLRIHLFAFENDISRLQEGQSIDFFVQSRPTSIRTARIVWINNFVNQDNNSYEIHADIIGDNSGLSPGEYVEARVINREETVNTLPIEAITYDRGLAYIFVKKKDEGEEVHFEKVQIQLGENDLGYVEILPIDQIPENAIVVTKGAFFLMAHSKKDEGGGGHEH